MTITTLLKSCTSIDSVFLVTWMMQFKASVVCPYVAVLLGRTTVPVLYISARLVKNTHISPVLQTYVSTFLFRQMYIYIYINIHINIQRYLIYIYIYYVPYLPPSISDKISSQFVAVCMLLTLVGGGSKYTMHHYATCGWFNHEKNMDVSKLLHKCLDPQCQCFIPFK